MQNRVQKKKKISLTTMIFIALLAGALAGVIINYLIPSNYVVDDIIVQGVFYIVGQGFIRLMRMLVVPLVFCSIVCGSMAVGDTKKLGSVGVKTLIFYLCTTALAITVALTIANIFNPGKGLDMSQIQVTSTVSETTQSMSMTETLLDIIPVNIFNSLSEGNMLQIIVMAILLGFAIILVGEKNIRVVNAFNDLNEIFMKCMEMILKLSPIGVFCLLCPVIAANGPTIIGSLAMVLLAAYICYIVHMLVVYSLIVKTMGGLSPAKFLKGMLPAIMFAFSSASSVGTLPINLECTEKLGAKREVASFVLPLGATINMDGTAIYQGVCAIFIASCYGISLTLPQMLTIVLTATLASIGTAGVPGAGMIMLAMVLTSVGLPVDGIALVAGVDRIFDMGRTTVNITGDAACTIVVSNMESRREARKGAKQ